MFKNKRVGGRPSFRGVAPFISFILALCIFCGTWFNAFAFTQTDSSTVGEFECPDTSTLWTQWKQQSFNVFLFYNPTTEYYYFVGVKDMSTLQGTDCQFLYDGSRIYLYWTNYWENYGYGYNNNQYMKIYYWSHNMAENMWYEGNFLSDAGGKYFVTSDYILLAYDMFYPHMLDVNNDGNAEEIFYWGHVDTSNYQLYYSYSVATSKLSFDENGHLSNYSNDSTNTDKTSSWFRKLKQWLETLGSSITNAIGNIQGWLTNLGTAISNAIGNIQGWLSNLGTTISGFFNTLWTNLSGWFSDLWDGLADWFADVGDWFSSLGDRISDFFVNLGLTIKGFFIPDDTFWDTYKNQFLAFINAHFTGLIDCVNLIDTLMDSFANIFASSSYPPSNYYIHLPTIRMPVIRTGNSVSGGRYAKTIIEEGDYNLYDLLTFNGNEHMITIYNVWVAFSTFIIVLLGVYYIKGLFMKFFQVQTEGGSDL